MDHNAEDKAASDEFNVAVTDQEDDDEIVEHNNASDIRTDRDMQRQQKPLSFLFVPTLDVDAGSSFTPFTLPKSFLVYI
jgi:hypothetical protein